MPPATTDDDALRDDLAVANDLLADGIDVIDRSAIAALTVEHATTSDSGMPMQRNFESVVTWSKAGPSMHKAWMSEEIVSG